MELAHQTIGSGRPVVLLHGYLSSRKYWRSLVRLLRANYRVITVDLRGFGASPKPRGAVYALDDHAGAVAAAIRELSPDQAVTLVGHSMGAQVAARVAGQYPELVDRLLLVNMPVFLDAASAHAAYYGTSYFHQITLYSLNGAFLWPLIKLVRPTVQLLTRRGKIAYSPRHTNHSRYYSLVDTVEKASAPELLSAITCPTLLVMARRDRREYGTNLVQIPLPPHIRVDWVDGHHHTPQENPAYIADCIARL